MDRKTQATSLHDGGDLEGALSTLSSGLDSDPDNITLLYNRGIIHLKLDNFGQALRDAEHVLLFDPCHLKAKCTKGLALVELGRYAESIQFLSETLTFVTAERERVAIEMILHEARLFQRQSDTGEGYGNNQPKVLEEVIGSDLDFTRMASFTKRVKVGHVEGKGRGLIATVDIPPGQLVLVSKAFCLIPAKRGEFCTQQENELKEISSRLLKELMEKIVKKIKDQPESLADVMHLWAGPEMKLLEKEDQDVKNGELDMVRLAEIIKLNAYGRLVSKLSPNPYVHLEFSQLCFPGNFISPGLWLPLSYINHTCYDGNVMKMTSGDTVFLIARKLIPAGTEITMNYCTSFHPMSLRGQMLDRLGFVCDCQLCEVDKKEGLDVEKARTTIIEEIYDKYRSSDVKTLDVLYQRVEDMRKATPHLNLGLLPLVTFLQSKANIDEVDGYCEKYDERVYDLNYGTDWHPASVMAAFDQVITSFCSENFTRKKKWAKRFRDAILLRDGNLDLMEEQVRQSMAHELDQLGSERAPAWKELCAATAIADLYQSLSLNG